MLKIGVVDYYLDNWHANYYPGFLREAIARAGTDAEVATAWAVKNLEGGATTAAWCEARNIRPAATLPQLLQEVDAVMVIAADDSRFHKLVCPETLACGKPVFVDKTFAYDVATAKRFFGIAQQYGTPVFSASAQRYCQDLLDYKAEGLPTRFMSTVGPHSLDNYAVHGLEPILAVMGPGIQRVKAFSVGSAVTQLVLDYGDGRLASFTQSPQPWAEFNFMVSDGETGRRLKSDDSNFYANLMDAMLAFFQTGIAPVDHHETLEVVALIETARKARLQPDTWFALKY